jgi:hypothetical protein
VLGHGLGWRAARTDTGIGDQRVDPAEALQYRCGSLVERRAVAHVGAQGNGVALAGGCNGLGGRLVEVQARH